jgi:deoxyribonuclease V
VVISGINKDEEKVLTLVDSAYRDNRCVTATIAFENWGDSVPAESIRNITDVKAPYRPGEFYQRELPPILEILRLIPWKPSLILIDGYVWLDADRPGLGSRLYEALGRAVPVIGIAKSPFRQNSTAIAIFRGKSQSPLFITSAGIDPNRAAEMVKSMHGQFRIPTLLKLVDLLSKEKAQSPKID